MIVRNRTGRASILAALGVTSLALVAATPASAIYRDYEPSEAEAPVVERTANTDDTSGNEGCTITLQNPDGSPGQSVKYAHGYSFSVKNKATGKTHTYTCNNGKWEETVNATSPTGGYVYDADRAWLDASTLVVVNLHEEYTYSPSGGSYFQP
jgi:hypothetical protein